MKKMVVLVGISGGGKSSLARQLADEAQAAGQRAVICSTDDFFTVDGVYKFDPTKLGRNHWLNREKAAKACADGVDLIVIDNTNLRQRDRKPYEEMAAAHGYECETRVVGSFDPEFVKLCADRNQHGVPLASIEKMARKVQLPETTK